MRALIAAGANLHVVGPARWTPLHHAVLSGNQAVVHALLAAGADGSDLDHRGKFPGIAFERGRDEVFRAMHGMRYRGL